MSFLNKVVIVTGGSSGIGAAVAKAFSQKQADVAIVGRNKEKLEKVREECATLGKEPLVILADVSNDEDVKRIINKTLEKFNKIDVLVNNAGMGRYGTILDGGIMKSFDEVLNVNLRAVVYATTLAAPHLVKTKGNIINISSIAGSIVLQTPGSHAYCTSKAGLNHFSKSAASELSAHGVRVNAISPGPVVTDILENSGLNFTWDSAVGTTALKRVSQPDEVAELVLYLASDSARGVTGSNYVLDNGVSIYR